MVIFVVGGLNADEDDRGSQTRLTLKCMFPRYGDWRYYSTDGVEMKKRGAWW
jgi:hypothetical protein